jgi:iron-sulfur cluster repair protein YtfE (RIC family)
MSWLIKEYSPEEYVTQLRESQSGRCARIRENVLQDVSFFHNPLNQNILRLLEMSEDFVHCRSCQALMELHKLYETKYEDGVLHLIKEYRCKLCRSILIRDFGEVAPSSEVFPQIVEDEINIG